MQLSSDYSLTKLFITKQIVILADKQELVITLPSIRDLIDNKDWNIAYKIFTTPADKLFPNLIKGDATSFATIQLLLYSLGQFDNFRPLYTSLLNGLSFLLKDFQLDPINKSFKSGNVSINEEIWDYVLSIVRLSYGEKVTLPPTFDSDEARQFYLAQKKAEEQVAAIKNNKQGDPDGLIKIFLSIVYAFPTFTFDYLYNQTLAQIQWLQKYAAGSVSYEVNAQAFAAGNMKKGSKLDFFIK